MDAIQKIQKQKTKEKAKLDQLIAAFDNKIRQRNATEKRSQQHKEP